MRMEFMTLVAALVFTATTAGAVAGETHFAGAEAAEEETNSLFVSRRDSIIYKLEKGGPTPLFYVQHKFRLQSLSVSPNDDYFAFIDIKAGEFRTAEAEREGKYEVPPQVRLRIIDSGGGLLYSLPDAQRYMWSPDGNQIAYITCDLTYADYQDRRPTGLYVFDVSSGETKDVDALPTELYWAEHDNKLYFTNPYTISRSVLRWNPETNEIEKTPCKDIYFSPDGEYYLSLNKVEYKPVQLYDATSNEELFVIEVRGLVSPPGVIAEAFPKDIGALAGSSYLESLKPWVPSSEHLLHFIKEDVEKELAGTGPVKRIVSRVVKAAEHYLFDVEKREVVRQFTGKPTEWISNGKVLVLERDGKLVLEQLSVGD